MSDSGLKMGTEGNVSAHTPDSHALITPSDLDYAVMEPEDVVLVDLDGRVLNGSFEPSTETPMNTGIYRVRPEASRIVHTHARYTMTLAGLKWEILPVHYMLALLSNDGRVPLAVYGTEEIARNASAVLDDWHRTCPPIR